MAGVFGELCRPIERWNNDELSVSNREWAVNYDEAFSFLRAGGGKRHRGGV